MKTNTANTTKTKKTDNITRNEDDFANKEVKVSIARAKQIISAEKDLLILDTRSKAEYNAGHIEGAIVIPYNKLENNLAELEGYENKPILVYCRTGSRSAVAVNTLIENGFNKIYHMDKGFSKWK